MRAKAKVRIQGRFPRVGSGDTFFFGAWGALAVLCTVFYHPTYDVCHSRAGFEWFSVVWFSRRILDLLFFITFLRIAGLVFAIVVSLFAKRSFTWGDISGPTISYVSSAPRTFAALAAIALALLYATDFRFDVDAGPSSATIHDRLTGTHYVQTYPATCDFSSEPRGYSP